MRRLCQKNKGCKNTLDKMVDLVNGKIKTENKFFIVSVLIKLIITT